MKPSSLLLLLNLQLQMPETSNQSSVWARLKAWAQRSWVWLTIFVLLLIGFLVALFRRRSVLPESREVELGEKAKEQAETKAQEAQKQARVERDQATTAIDEVHHQAIEHLTEEQSKKFEEMKDDPESITPWLFEIGKKNRGE